MQFSNSRSLSSDTGLEELLAPVRIPRTPLRTGIERTYEWFLEHVASRAV